MSGSTSARDARFAEFVAGSRDSLARAAWLLTTDKHLAEDLLQEALVRTYLAWNRIDPALASAYTRRIMVNLTTDRWRRRRFEPTLGDDSDRHGSKEALASFGAIEDRDDIVRRLRRLSARERTIVVLRYYEDLSEADVAAELGISVGTVKSTCSRALARLRLADDGTHGAERRVT